MTEDAYIAKVNKDNPAIMGAEKIQLTPAALTKALRAAWRSGRKEGMGSRVDDSLFGRVFGKP